MDLTPSEAEQLLQTNARDFLEARVSPEHIADLEDEGRFDDRLWSELADQGWFGLAVPAERGGAGGSLGDWALVLNELGRVACPLPVAEQAAAAQYLARTGAAADLIPGLLAGSTVATIALIDRPQTETVATIQGGAATLSGEKIKVPFGASATEALVSARKPDGTTAYFSLDPRGPGVRVTPTRTMSEGQHATLLLEDAPAVELGQASTDPGADLRELYLLAGDAYCVGLLDRILTIATDYTRDRVQFGRAIGSFQAVSHRIAEMAVLYHGARLLVAQSCWAIEEGIAHTAGCSMAHAHVRHAADEMVANGHQVHGAMGFTYEYPLHFYTRRAKAHQLWLGSPAVHRETVAAAMTG